MGRAGLPAAECSQAVGNRPNVVVILDLEQFRSVIVVGLNQEVASRSLCGQCNPTVGRQHDTLWPLESDA